MKVEILQSFISNKREEEKVKTTHRIQIIETYTTSLQRAKGAAKTGRRDGMREERMTALFIMLELFTMQQNVWGNDAPSTLRHWSHRALGSDEAIAQ